MVFENAITEPAWLPRHGRSEVARSSTGRRISTFLEFEWHGVIPVASIGVLEGDSPPLSIGIVVHLAAMERGPDVSMSDPVDSALPRR